MHRQKRSPKPRNAFDAPGDRVTDVVQLEIEEDALAGAGQHARKGSGLRILAVTVLTSYDNADLAAAGYDFTVPELVAERAAQARDIGVDGLVCSAEEAANLRGIASTGMVLVTPGIRPAGAEKGDQKRIMTPARAIAAGADHLVVGRPILEAPDPKAAAEAIVDEIAGATR